MVNSFANDPQTEPDTLPETQWMGRPLSELSKDELITVIEMLGCQLEAVHTEYGKSLALADMMLRRRMAGR